MCVSLSVIAAFSTRQIWGVSFCGENRRLIQLSDFAMSNIIAFCCVYYIKKEFCNIFKDLWLKYMNDVKCFNFPVPMMSLLKKIWLIKFTRWWIKVCFLEFGGWFTLLLYVKNYKWTMYPSESLFALEWLLHTGLNSQWCA